MSSIREQILSTIVTVLNGATVAGSNIFRERETPISRDMVPAIVVTPEEETDRLINQLCNECTLMVSIGIYTRGDPADQIADPIATAMHTILMTNHSILALVIQVKKNSSKWEQHEADQTAGVLTMSYQFRYLHTVADITTIL